MAPRQKLLSDWTTRIALRSTKHSKNFPMSIRKKLKTGEIPKSGLVISFDDLWQQAANIDNELHNEFYNIFCIPLRDHTSYMLDAYILKLRMI